MHDAGYRRHCAGCAADHFPRTDPVIIIVVRKQGYILLGRQASWTAGMYSALAGFMEPGETIEDAARREVFEESGIRLGAVTYVASQPWPFPASLMIGLHGEAISDDIRIDEKELEEARWFSLAEARMMVDRTHPEGLWATRSQAIAHLLVTEALK
jgi:NAD+ diphosphatase